MYNDFMNRIIKDNLEKLLDLIYPPSIYCGICGNLIDETRSYSLCDHCVRHILWDTGGICEEQGLKLLRCAEYGLYARSLIFSLKYSGKRYISRSIAEMMRDKLAAAGVYADVIVPVPLYSEKENARGFNQTELIGRHLAEFTGMDFAPGTLKRVRATRPMRGLSPTEREQNVYGSFSFVPAYEPMIRGRRVVIIDDFFATGATARECRRVLKEARPAEVLFLSFAAKFRHDELGGLPEVK